MRGPDYGLPVPVGGGGGVVREGRAGSWESLIFNRVLLLTTSSFLHPPQLP